MVWSKQINGLDESWYDISVELACSGGGGELRRLVFGEPRAVGQDDAEAVEGLKSIARAANAAR